MKSTKKLMSGFLFLLIFMSGSEVVFGQSGPAAVAAPVTVAGWNNGDPANRVDLVILGDGYDASQITLFRNHVDTFVAGLFNEDPFKEYKRYFNVHRIDVTSYGSGADHPDPSVYTFVDTAFNASFDYTPPDYRLLTLHDSGRVTTVLNNSGLQPTQRDIILVIVNDPAYGGSGGSIAVASINGSVVDLIKHELGHSFGLLADEYDYGSCNPWRTC